MKKRNKERQKTTSCGAITWRVREGKLQVLLIKQSEHRETWGIPKGHINSDETLNACAFREVLEETGVHVDLGTRLPDCHAHMKNEDKRVVIFLATPQHPLAEPNHNGPESEVADVKWTNVDELPPIVIYQQTLLSETIQLLKSKLLNGSEDR